MNIRKLFLSTLLVCAIPLSAGATEIFKFETMYGIDRPFVGSTEIRNVLGAELPWTIGSAVGSLSTDGTLVIKVRSLVFSFDPVVPAVLRGTNDEAEFRGLVSCLTTTEDGTMAMANIKTKGFAATPEGHSQIKEKLILPSPCIAPIVFIMSGSEDKWFSVTGAEMDGPFM